MQLISIIVPAYNSESYLEKCVDSLLAQTYTDYELILVDDGSTDSTAQICDAYREKDARVRVIHQKNGGLSDARNAGIREASGDYLAFVDSDDWADPELLSVLWEGIGKGATISACGFYTVRNGKAVAWRNDHDDYRVLPAVEAVRDMLYTKSIDTSAWAKLFHKSCFSRILFPKGHLYEEVATTYRLFLTQEKIALTTRPLYYYVKHAGSIVTSSFSDRHMDMLAYSQEMLDLAKERYPELIPAAKRRIVYACFYLLKTMGNRYAEYPGQTRTIMAQFKSYERGVMKDPEAPRRDKAAILMLRRGVPFFERCWALYSGLTGRHGNS